MWLSNDSSCTQVIFIPGAASSNVWHDPGTRAWPRSPEPFAAWWMLTPLQAFLLLWQGILSPLCCGLPGVPVLLVLCWFYCGALKIPRLMFACCSSEDPAPGHRDFGLMTSRFKLGVLFIMIEILYVPSKDIFISTRLFQYKSAS